jgi:hypothetical protein
MAKKPKDQETPEEAAELPEGFALVAHADPGASCSVGRQVFGGVLVPMSAVAALAAHGFSVVTDPVASDLDPIDSIPAEAEA